MKKCLPAGILPVLRDRLDGKTALRTIEPQRFERSRLGADSGPIYFETGDLR